MITFQSPLSLLREWNTDTGAGPLREVLVTGYTADLVFLERHLVSLSRGLGARVTVLTDPGQAVHDPVDVRHAGSGYQHGHARCAKAFHPKLVVLVGDEQVRVALGSGNPTLAGWGHNDELWLVLRAERGRGPVALADLGAWLEDLPRVVLMPSWIADTVRSVADAVTPDRPDGTHPDLRIAGNLRAPLLRLLPVGPVDALAVSAPFFDAASAAVRAIVARTRPAATTLALQPTMSQYDGTTLGAAVPGAVVAVLDETRMRHGKLVEWVVDGARRAVVGSANPSAAAMLTSTEAGGNCELVAVCPITDSLVPKAVETVPVVEVSGVSTIPDQRTGPSSPALVVVGARLRTGVASVELSSQVGGRVVIEMSESGQPGTWAAVHEVVPEPRAPLTATDFPTTFPAGSSVRARAGDITDPTVSSVVNLTDTARCEPRDDSAPRAARDHDPEKVFLDASLFQQLVRDIEELHIAFADQPHADPARMGAARTDPHGSWALRTETMLGASFAAWVYPGLLPGPAPVADHSWEEEPEGEEDEVVVTAALDEPDGEPDVERVHARMRKDAAKLAARVRDAEGPAATRAAAVKVYLTLLAAGVWKGSDAWRADFADVVTAVIPSEQEQRELPAMALDMAMALTAVGVAVLLRGTSLRGTSGADRLGTRVWERARDVIPHAEPRHVDEYLRIPLHHQGIAAVYSEVEELISFTTEAVDDPRAVVRENLAKAGFDARLESDTWVLDGEFGNPRLTAAKVATISQAPCSVLVRTATRAVVVLWSGNQLALAESTFKKWRHYTLSPVSSPRVLLGSSDGLPATSRQYPLEPVAPPTAELAADTGADIGLLVLALKTA
ncbi:phospholipase D-like domain-containing protein [Actinokineospora spheciospongiae]|uniref:hypothetical protein n=1 Tax=Actinokineospora spheciospongiae TaxID=909613 RepID=UPI000D717572|nr:hypothetical protein [Actinokineospora spheciospongiae]PWW56807.1 hypothetical protein DFQ13_1108 [Actinokineospora spheciospongiae]